MSGHSTSHGAFEPQLSIGFEDPPPPLRPFFFFSFLPVLGQMGSTTFRPGSSLCLRHTRHSPFSLPPPPRKGLPSVNSAPSSRPSISPLSSVKWLLGFCSQISRMVFLICSPQSYPTYIVLFSISHNWSHGVYAPAAQMMLSSPAALNSVCLECQVPST